MFSRATIEHDVLSLARGLAPGLAPDHRRGKSGRDAGAGLPWRGSRVQTLLFDADKWTERRAVAWARRHGFVALKVHRTAHYVRVRQFTPTPGLPKRTIRFGLDPDAVGISAVVEAR